MTMSFGISTFCPLPIPGLLPLLFSVQEHNWGNNCLLKQLSCAHLKSLTAASSVVTVDCRVTGGLRLTDTADPQWKSAGQLSQA